jgi:AraC family transcriptional regulator
MTRLAEICRHGRFVGLSPDELDTMVPSTPIFPPTGDRWAVADLRANAYEKPYECYLPPLRDFMLVSYQKPTIIARKFDGRWKEGVAKEGFLTLASAKESTAWYWNKSMNNDLLHIKAEVMLQVGLEVFNRDVSNVIFMDDLFIWDPSLINAITMLKFEAKQPGAGERLLVESLINQICVILLRHHANVTLRPVNVVGGLSPYQAREIVNYIEENLASRLSIAELAQVIQISGFHFSRQFKRRFNVPPHTFVTSRRVERARVMLEQGDISLKRVAAMTGFCDQAHLTRQFKRHFGITPKTAQRELEAASV